MSSRISLTSKIYDKIIKRPSKSHETIPLKGYSHEYNNVLTILRVCEIFRKKYDNMLSW
jgi:hypothetical protein